jgi:protein SCO1/2
VNRFTSKAWSLTGGLIAAAVLVAASLTGCGSDTATPTNDEPPAVVDVADDGFYGTLVDPPLHPPRVVLRDTRGAAVDLSRPGPDKATVLFFGFTHCDDVCPTTMADLAVARHLLPPALADRVVVWYVTVDPDRDTPAVLQQWLARFDPDFTGLRGPAETVHHAERSLYLPESSPASPTPPQPADHHSQETAGEDYQVDHAGSVYVFGPGDTTLLYSGGTTPQQYADDLHRILTT